MTAFSSKKTDTPTNKEKPCFSMFLASLSLSKVNIFTISVYTEIVKSQSQKTAIVKPKQRNGFLPLKALQRLSNKFRRAVYTRANKSFFCS